MPLPTTQSADKAIKQFTRAAIIDPSLAPLKDIYKKLKDPLSMLQANAPIIKHGVEAMKSLFSEHEVSSGNLEKSSTKLESSAKSLENAAQTFQDDSSIVNVLKDISKTSTNTENYTQGILDIFKETNKPGDIFSEIEERREAARRAAKNGAARGRGYPDAGGVAAGLGLDDLDFFGGEGFGLADVAGIAGAGAGAAGLAKGTTKKMMTSIFARGGLATLTKLSWYGAIAYMVARAIQAMTNLTGKESAGEAVGSVILDTFGAGQSEARRLTLEQRGLPPDPLPADSAAAALPAGTPRVLPPSGVAPGNGGAVPPAPAPAGTPGIGFIPEISLTNTSESIKNDLSAVGEFLTKGIKGGGGLPVPARGWIIPDGDPGITPDSGGALRETAPGHKSHVHTEFMSKEDAKQVYEYLQSIGYFPAELLGVGAGLDPKAGHSVTGAHPKGTAFDTGTGGSLPKTSRHAPHSPEAQIELMRLIEEYAKEQGIKIKRFLVSPEATGQSVEPKGVEPKGKDGVKVSSFLNEGELKKAESNSEKPVVVVNNPEPAAPNPAPMPMPVPLPNPRAAGLPQQSIIDKGHGTSLD